MAKLEKEITRSINLKFPLEKSEHGAFKTNDSTIQAVADDLIVLIQTNYGERVIHYDFGANLRPIIFNQGPDVKQQITDAINLAVEKWMPFVLIKDIIVTNSEDNPSLHPNEVNIKIIFGIGRTALQGETEVTVSS